MLSKNSVPEAHVRSSLSIGTEFDREMMQRCLQLARRALGQTSPNLLVGSVVVREEKIVGEGFYLGADQPHAEVLALREAGEQAKGATVYVNLEPCNHDGKTSPSTEELLAVGVAKVVVGMVNPEPRVATHGIEQLRQAGIEVVVGVEEAACRQLNEAFIHRILYKRPFGILKYAMTLDGKIATTGGHSAWVTTKASRHQVHQLRSATDAVIIGGNTVRRDNPHLTSHEVAAHNPLRVVMSRTLNLPKDSHLWQTEVAPTLVVTEPNINPRFQKHLHQQGVEIVEITPLTPKRLMEYLYERQLNSMLWECGGTLAAKAITEGAVQKIVAFIAPKIIGGQAAPSAVGDLGLEKMTEAITLERVSWRSIESDLVVEGYIPQSCWDTKFY